MSQELTVSLLNLDQAALTIQVLEPLAALSGEDWRIRLILVDNGSRAEELARLQDWMSMNRTRFEETLFVAASRNLGSTGGRNLAFKLASTDRMLVLDNDVILPSGSAWLQRLSRRLDLEPQVGIVAPMLVFADRPDVVQATGIALTREGRVGYINRNRPSASISPEPIDVVAAPSACWVIRRTAQQAAGLLSEAYYPVQYEDVDLCVRLRLAGWKIVCDPGVRVGHIENVTTRSLGEHPFARLTVRNHITFKEKWSDVLPQLATIDQDDISW
jgi:GT2 family glycosyltransferase